MAKVTLPGHRALAHSKAADVMGGRFTLLPQSSESGGSICQDEIDPRRKVRPDLDVFVKSGENVHGNATLSCIEEGGMAREIRASNGASSPAEMPAPRGNPANG